MELNDLMGNVEFSEEWLMKKIIETFEKEKKTGKKRYVRMKEIDFYNLFIQFIRLNKRGE